MQTNRPPVIVILGHVDHGKTTLLDYLRNTNIAAREAGGITQHIRSFQLKTEKFGLMTFIDTPGHAAFSQMRSRGSQLADIAILVVSAADGVMPQTRESIEFIRASGIPCIVTITKSDLPGADPDKVKTQLTEANIIVEDFGGKVPAAVVSAKTGEGIPELLNLIHLVWSLNPPQADPEGRLELVVIESRLDSQKGPLAAVVVKNGTLKVAQELFQDKAIGKVRAILSSEGQNQNTALPSTPVEIIGLSGVPAIGSRISSQSFTLAPAAVVNPAENLSSGKLNLVIRADAQGSLEALVSSLGPETNILSSGTGDVTENDILLAKASQAWVIGFNVRIPASVAKLAEIEKVPLDNFKIIYEIIESLDKILHPKVTETILGKAAVVAQFKIGPDKIAGCKCLEGVIRKSDTVRLVRGDNVIGQSRVKSLHLGKSEADSVKSGSEFGAILAPFLDFKIGDSIIAFTNHGQA